VNLAGTQKYHTGGRPCQRVVQRARPFVFPSPLAFKSKQSRRVVQSSAAKHVVYSATAVQRVADLLEELPIGEVVDEVLGALEAHPNVILEVRDSRNPLTLETPADIFADLSVTLGSALA
jgi:hypothetical protein